MKNKYEWFVALGASWLLAVSLPAAAGTIYQWNAGNCASVGGSPAITLSCTDTSTSPSGGPTVTYSAISDTGATTNGQKGLAAAYVGNYNPNLGATSAAGPNSSPANTQESTTPPDHALDNNLNSEFIELNFGGTSVNLTQVQLGYFSGDSDITVLAYTGGGAPSSFTGKTYNNTGGNTGLLQNGWQLVGNYFDVCGASCTSAAPKTATITNPYSSSYWLIGAFNNLGNAAIGDSVADYVKILTASGCVGAGCVTTSQVPEPPSLLLAAIALLGLTVLRRRGAL